MQMIINIVWGRVNFDFSEGNLAISVVPIIISRIVVALQTIKKGCELNSGCQRRHCKLTVYSLTV